MLNSLLRLVISTLLITLLQYLAPPAVVASPKSPAKWEWVLPQPISDTNTEVSFEVDSTWHLIHGKTSGVKGQVWLETPKDPLSVRATISFPVNLFNTDGEMRDERLREVMDSQHSPNVMLQVKSFIPECEPATVNTEGKCPVRIDSNLKIRGIELQMPLRAELSREGNLFRLRGIAKFSWLDFGVEDPSILVAKLDPEVVVSFSVVIPAAETQNIR